MIPIDKITLQNLSVGYHGVPLIQNIELEFSKGEIICLVGPNGGGKSTVLKTLARQLEAVSGSVWIDNEELKHISGRELAKKQSILLTERIKTDKMSCKEVVALGRYPYTGSFGVLKAEDEKIILETMEELHILELANQDYMSLSDGQKQRVLIAKALCQEPEILILDEPTSYLDIRYKLELMQVLEKLAKKKRVTILLSLHECNLALQIADRLVCIKGDKITGVFSPDEVEDTFLDEIYELPKGTIKQLYPNEFQKQGTLDKYIYKNGKELRFGYTTGTCAAAATKAAAICLLTGEKKKEIKIHTPKGWDLTLNPVEWSKTDTSVTCAIKKDAGDDADVTNGILVYATVEKLPTGFEVDGGVGVGRVTKPGLEQPVGAAAINQVPRQMIREAMEEVVNSLDESCGLRSVISIPEGVEIGAKTFNPRLGIEGGISVLGTSGIVEPMSEQALVDTIRTELKVKLANSGQNLMITPGNYGETFIRQKLQLELDDCVKYSNFLGETMDMLGEFGAKKVLLIGHIGKLVKVGSGIFQTHSRVADARMETLCACAIEAGCEMDEVKKVLSCITTEEAVEYLLEIGKLQAVMTVLLNRVDAALQRRAQGKYEIGVIIFSNQTDFMIKSALAERMLQDGTFCGCRPGGQ